MRAWGIPSLTLSPFLPFSLFYSFPVRGDGKHGRLAMPPVTHSDRQVKTVYQPVSLRSLSRYTLCLKKGHSFCFCYNFVSRDQNLVFFGNLVAKEICNRPLLTYLKVIAGALR